MPALKPRAGDGPFEAERDLRGITLRVPLEGGGRLVLELQDDDVIKLRDVLEGVIKK